MISITNDGSYLHIVCSCGHGEQHPADEQRSHIQTFDFELTDDPRVDRLTCHACGTTTDINEGTYYVETT